MAITLSHQSALDAIRTIRSEGANVRDAVVVQAATPCPWVGKRLSMKNFDPSVWRWGRPTRNSPLHVMVPSAQARIRGNGFISHTAPSGLPAGSFIWLDNNSSMVCPELLFLQMANSLSFPALVMLGLELCGHFTRQANDPLMGDVIDGIPVATSVESLKTYLSDAKQISGLAKAREAVGYVCDHAASAPEALLATVFGLPCNEAGYNMGSVLLNDRVQVDDTGYWKRMRNRYPDLMFDFAPVGLNYDGSKHFDISALMGAAEVLARAEANDCAEAREELRKMIVATKEKVIDDNMRDRQLAAEGRIVFSVTKEDLSTGEHLDALARQVLRCANKTFGVNVDEHLSVLDDTALKRERHELLASLTPYAHLGASSYGRL